MNKIALTFDDGPNARHTDELLAVLARHGVKATFFMIGKFAAQLPEVARRVAIAGHAIGNHTMNHARLTELAEEDIAREISDCDGELGKIVGEHSLLFRAPFMLSNAVVEKIVEDYGLTPVGYDAAGGDGAPRTADEIFAKVVNELGDGGGTVLLHDGCHHDVNADRSSTIEAVDRLIARRKWKDGFEFALPQELT